MIKLKPELIKEYIELNEKKEKEFSLRMKKTLKKICVITIFFYIIIVIPLLYMGIKTITIPIIGFMTSSILIPILTFFSGIWIMWNFKFSQ